MTHLVPNKWRKNSWCRSMEGQVALKLCRDNQPSLLIKWVSRIWAILNKWDRKSKWSQVHIYLFTTNPIGGYMTSFRDIELMRKSNPPEIEVCNPVLKAGTVSKHHVYTLRGRDKFGEFEVLRRYKEFHLFRDVLITRYLGLYIPPIPGKKIAVSQLSHLPLNNNLGSKRRELCWKQDIFSGQVYERYKFVAISLRK